MLTAFQQTALAWDFDPNSHIPNYTVDKEAREIQFDFTARYDDNHLRTMKILLDGEEVVWISNIIQFKTNEDIIAKKIVKQ